MIDSFNVGTNQWVALWVKSVLVHYISIYYDYNYLFSYVYKRLKWLGSKMLSQVIALAFLSLWHGVWPGYALCFSFEFFAVMAERQVFVFPLTSTCCWSFSLVQFQLVGKRLFGCSLHELCWHVRLPLLLVLFLMRYFLLLYPLMFFLLLTWSSCWKVIGSTSIWQLALFDTALSSYFSLTSLCACM